MIKGIFYTARNSLLIISIGVAFYCHAETVMPQRVLSKSPVVASVQWEKNGEPQRWGVAALNETESLKLSFDVLDNQYSTDDVAWLRCRIERRDIDWNPDNLIEIEYLDGFNDAEIGYGQLSAPGLTTQSYRHYETPVPPPGIKPLISGNYLLHIFTADNPDSILLSIPFFVEENSAAINAIITTATDIDYNRSHQQVNVEVKKGNLHSSLNAQDVTLKIGKNFEPFSWRKLSTPTSGSKDAFIYTHSPQLIFPAGNEYRRFDTSNHNHPGIHIDNILWDNDSYRFNLQIDEPRADSNYVFDNTQHGGFSVNATGIDDSDLEADYVKVLFTLKMPQLIGYDVYVNGDLCDNPSAMEYDVEDGVYRWASTLKQGAYDYQYAIRNKAGEISPAIIEGDFYSTQNIYPILVYYHIPGERTQRLARATVFKSY